ncbi:MAG: radical SAM protein [Thermodesulfobacteriota bacterium]|nr:radical SAM protein [Thermodesulfobacteriota bacterium]
MTRINTINSIEISSICNGNCQYCPARVQHKYRETGLMSWSVFEKTIAWIKVLCENGTQREVNLFGVGESTLHPELVAMVKYAREKIPFRIPLHLNTNGILMTKELAIGIRDAGVNHIDITGHDHYHTAKTIRIFREVGIAGELTYDFVVRPHNWAGQVDWFEIDKTVYDPGPCPWLAYGQVMVMSNGDITPCCIDAFGSGVFGHVNNDITKLEILPFELCQKCHHTIPGIRLVMPENRIMVAR